MYTFSSPSYTTMPRDGLGCFHQYPSSQILIWLTSALASAVLSDPFRVLASWISWSSLNFIIIGLLPQEIQIKFVLVSPNCLSTDRRPIAPKCCWDPRWKCVPSIRSFHSSTLLAAPKVLPQYRMSYIPPQGAEPNESNLRVGQPCVALGRMWGSVQWELWSHLPLDVWPIPFALLGQGPFLAMFH